jgi:hypothetical protein
MQSNGAHFASRTEVCADPTEEGIPACGTLDDVGSRPTEEFDEDSDFDENEEILTLERRDFDDDEGIDADLDKAYYHTISFSA